MRHVDRLRARRHDDQDLALQRSALKAAGCRRLYEEKVSGAKRDRPELARMMDALSDEDVVVVTRLDRLARSTKDLLDIAEQLNGIGAGLRSLAEPWADTTSPAGRMILTVFAGIAEFERSLIHQRTSSEREAARKRGVRFGRLLKLSADQVVLGRRLVEEGKSVRDAAALLKCHHATLYRALQVPESGRGAAHDGRGWKATGAPDDQRFELQSGGAELPSAEWMQARS